ncbi:MAG: DUF4386 domain-containing protein [Acidimicrobiia bacterium]
MTDDAGTERSQRAYARFAGLMYLVVLATHLAGVVLVTIITGDGAFDDRAQRIIASEELYRIALACSLAGSLFTVLLATGLYATLRPVDRNLATMALLFRTGESVVGPVGIATSFAVLHASLAVRDATAFDADQLGALASMFSSVATTEIAAIFFSLGSTIFFYVFLRSTYKVMSAWGIFASLCYAALWFARLIVPDSPALVV